MNCLEFKISEININENYLYPFLGLFGFMITYFGNKFVKPTLFLGGMIASSSGSYKLTEFVLKEIKYDSCEIVYASTIILSISSGFIALKIFHLLNFILGLLTGASIGYIVYISGLNKICLGIYFIYDNMFWICTIIPGIICGIITHYKEQELSIILTSLIGPALSIIGLKRLIDGKELLKNNNLEYIIYGLLYIMMSSTGFYLQRKREKKKKQINYTNNYRTISL